MQRLVLVVAVVAALGCNKKRETCEQVADRLILLSSTFERSEAIMTKHRESAIDTCERKMTDEEIECVMAIEPPKTQVETLRAAKDVTKCVSAFELLMR